MLDRPAPPVPSSGPAQRELAAAARALGVPEDYGRARGLRRVREARSVEHIGRDAQGRDQWLAPRAARAWQRMRAAAAADGVELHIVSAFRSAAYQLDLLRRKLARGQSIDQILRVSAAPGYSEHHTGRALDVTTPGFTPLEEEFERSAAFAWLVAHAARFGFRLSYPRDNPHGIAFEPWHWCWHAKPRTR
jgi:D-alanyl-D-alanine carboxypeptidase